MTHTSEFDQWLQTRWYWNRDCHFTVRACSDCRAVTTTYESPGSLRTCISKCEQIEKSCHRALDGIWSTTSVASCIREMAESLEFDVTCRFSQRQLKSRQTSLKTLRAQSDSQNDQLLLTYGSALPGSFY